jgi:hypothetical protein
MPGGLFREFPHDPNTATISQEVEALLGKGAVLDPVRVPSPYRFLKWSFSERYLNPN